MKRIVLGQLHNVCSRIRLAYWVDVLRSVMHSKQIGKWGWGETIRRFWWMVSTWSAIKGVSPLEAKGNFNTVSRYKYDVADGKYTQYPVYDNIHLKATVNGTHLDISMFKIFSIKKTGNEMNPFVSTNYCLYGEDVAKFVARLSA